jgi:hypothetical protein
MLRAPAARLEEGSWRIVWSIQPSGGGWPGAHPGLRPRDGRQFCAAPAPFVHWRRRRFGAPSPDLDTAGRKPARRTGFRCYVARRSLRRRIVSSWRLASRSPSAGLTAARSVDGTSTRLIVTACVEVDDARRRRRALLGQAIELPRPLVPRYADDADPSGRGRARRDPLPVNDSSLELMQRVRVGRPAHVPTIHLPPPVSRVCPQR